MTHGGILSCAGLFKPIPGCRGTACHASGLGSPLHGPSGVDRDICDPKGVSQWCFAALLCFLNDGGILSSAGLFNPIPGCRGTACHALGLGAPLQGPAGVDRDACDPKGVQQWCFAAMLVS